MNKKQIIISIIATISMILLLTLITYKNYLNTQDSYLFKKEYESLNNTIRKKDNKKIRSITIPQNNPMIYTQEDEVIKKIKNNDTFLIYFGFSDCPWCRSVIPNLIKAANDLGLKEIYYVDIKNIRDTIELKEGQLKTTTKGTKGYYELIKLLDNVLEDYTITDDNNNEISTNEKRIYAPNIVAITKGKAKKLTYGISSKQTDGYMKLTKEMNKESYNSFKCVINCILENDKICTQDKKC